MSLGHFTIDIDDDLKSLLIRMWTERRLEFGDLVLQLPNDVTRITLDRRRMTIEPPLSVAKTVRVPVFGQVKAGTTVSAISCDPRSMSITIDLNRSPLDVKVI